MLNKTKSKNAAIAARSAALPSIPKELIDLFVTGPMSGDAVNAASVAFKKVTTSTRWPSLPDVPTIAESGLPGFNIENWQGVFLPAGTRVETVAKLARDIASVASERAFA